jgi:hypothetical protein
MPGYRFNKEDPARISVEPFLMRVKKKRYDYIQPLEQGGKTVVMYEELYCAAKKKTQRVSEMTDDMKTLDLQK